MKKKDLNEIYLPILNEEEKIDFNSKKSISLYDPNEFEAFIYEWVKYCKYKDKDISIYNIGGTGDHGIDIYVFSDSEEVVYQCKRNEKALCEAQIKTIIVKVLWYFFKDFDGKKYPNSIEIIALNDFGIKGARLFEDKEKLKKDIIEYYTTALKTEKINYKNEELKFFKKYLELFNYKYTRQSKIDNVIKDYRKSDISQFRFKNVNQNITRRNVEEIIKSIPNEYEKQIINVLNEQEFSIEEKDEYLNNAKNDFYSAVSLRETCFYFFGKYEEFEKIENNVLSFINTLKFNIYNSKFERMQKILGDISSLSLDDSYLVYSLHMVNYPDRKGTCHLVVNNGKFNWEK